MSRTHGIMFVIKGFLPVDRKNVDKQIEALNLIKVATEDGDVSFIKKLKIIDVEGKQTSVDDDEMKKAEEARAKAKAKKQGKAQGQNTQPGIVNETSNPHYDDAGAEFD